MVGLQPFTRLVRRYSDSRNGYSIHAKHHDCNEVDLQNEELGPDTLTQDHPFGNIPKGVLI